MTVEFRSAYPMPDQVPPEPIAVYLDRERFKQWFEELEEEHLKHLSRLHALATEINGSILSSTQRLALLEAIEGHFESILPDIKLRLANTPFPPRREDLALASELQSLIQALIVGYDTVTLAGRYEARREMTGQSMHKAMVLLRENLFCASLLYQTAPARTWLALHRLYDYAESAGLERTDFEAIADIYRQALLFTAAGPQRLNHEELFAIYDSLPSWSKHTRITAPYLESESSLLIPVDADRPPSPAIAGQNNHPEFKRRLDMTDLIQHLRLSITQRTAESTDPRAARAHAGMLRRVIQSVGAPAKREFFRLPGNLGLEVSIGLDATLATMDAPSADNASAHALTVINESATGFCVAADAGVEVAIGDLLGIRLPDSPNTSIGVARWLHNGGKEGPRLGIELLANSADAITASSGDGTHAIAALLLPEIKATGQMQTLVLPTGVGANGMRLTLPGGRVVTLAAAIESTPTFDQFSLL